MRKGTIISESNEPRSYILESSGQHYRRNRRHLLKVKEEPQGSDVEVEVPNYNPVPSETAKEPDQEPERIQDPEQPQPEFRRSRYGRLIRPPDQLNL